MKPDHVLVRVRCNARREELTFCVRVNRGVPDELRCTPSGGGSSGGGSPLCSDCQALLQGDRLSEAVQEIVRRGWSEHVSAGAVVVSC